MLKDRVSVGKFVKVATKMKWDEISKETQPSDEKRKGEERGKERNKFSEWMGELMD